MIKVFIFNGSLNENSITDFFINNFLEKLYQNSEIEVNTYYLKNKMINNCIGCHRCFQCKKCLLDEKDSFTKLEMKC